MDVVAVVVALVEGVAPEVPPVALLLLVEPGPPIELVLPEVSLLLLDPGVVLLPPIALVPPGVVLLLPVLPPIALVLPGVVVLLLDVDVSRLGAGVVIVVELDDVDGAAGSLLVHAPSDTAAISASAAHEVRVAFIRKLLGGLFAKEARGSLDYPKGTLGRPHGRTVGSRR